MKIVYIVFGYEQKTEDGQLLDSCQIEVFAKNSDEAIKKAKKYIKKGFYRISQVIEKED